MKKNSPLYDRRTAQRVISRCSEFPEDTEGQRQLLEQVYGDRFNGESLDHWGPKVIKAAAQNVYIKLRETLAQSRSKKSDLEVEVDKKPKVIPHVRTELTHGQLSLFDGKPCT